jgi:hypothetical protein
MPLLAPLTGTLTPLATGNLRQTLLTGLVSYWKLDEASGQANDAHGVNHLTANNNPVSGVGKINNARQFVRASNQSLTLTGNSDLAFSVAGGASMTMSAWVYLDTKTNAYALISRGSAGSPASAFGYFLSYQTSGDRLRIQWSTGSSTRTLNADNFGAVPTATWLHIIAFIDRPNLRSGIRVNGGTINYDNSTLYSIALNSASLQFALGAIGSGTYHNGRIDEVGMWGRLLTDAEQLALYNSGAGLAYPFS